MTAEELGVGHGKRRDDAAQVANHFKRSGNRPSDVTKKEIGYFL